MAKETAGVKTGTTAAGVPPAKPAESSARTPNKAEHLFRYSSVDTESADDDELTIQVAFSSEEPVLRKATEADEKLGIATKGEKYWEVMSHRKEDSDLSALNTGDAAFLDEHDDSKQIGNVTRAKISKDKVGRAVLKLDGLSELSNTRFKQMRSGKRKGISCGYWHTGLVRDDGEKNGYPVKRVSWGCDEITSTRIPADETKAGVRRSAEGQWACLCCGDMFDRAKLDDNFECGCDVEVRSKRDALKTRTAAKADDFKFKLKRDAEDEISFSEVRQMVSSAADVDKRFKAKRANGDTYSAYYVDDIIFDAESEAWTARVYNWGDNTVWNVAFELEDDDTVTLGDATQMMLVQEYQPVERSTRSTAAPAPVDSPKLLTAEEAAQKLNPEQKKRMRILLDPNPAAGGGGAAAPTEAEVTARITPTITAEARKTEKANALARNKKITERADTLITDHGMKQRGKLGETLRKITSEFLTRDHGEAADTQVVAEYGQRCLEEIAKVQPEPYLLRARANEQEYKEYSMLRAIQSCVKREERLPEKSFELDIHEDMIARAKENGGLLGSTQDAGGFHVPMDAPTPRYSARMDKSGRIARGKMVGERFRRDLYTGDFGSGGALVPTELMTPIIEPLRNWTALDKVDVRFLGGLSGNIVIPRQTGVVAPQAVSEIGALVASQPDFDQISARPRRCGNQTKYSKQLIFQSSPDVEALIRDDNFKQIALLIDELGINGSGAGSQPLGVMNQPGIFAQIFGGTPTIALIEAMATKIRAANIREALAFLTTSNTRGRWRSIAAALVNATTVISGQQNAIWTGSDDEGDVTGRAAYDSQQIPNDQVILGAWDNLIWFQWAGVEVVVDPYTGAGTGEWLITMNTYNDFAVRHPQAFCVSGDSGNQ